MALLHAHCFFRPIVRVTYTPPRAWNTLTMRISVLCVPVRALGERGRVVVGRTLQQCRVHHGAGAGNAHPHTMLFMCGIPGAGKTRVLKTLYGLDRVSLLDLDVCMKAHPQYDPADPAKIYANPAAYK